MLVPRRVQNGPRSRSCARPDTHRRAQVPPGLIPRRKSEGPPVEFDRFGPSSFFAKTCADSRLRALLFLPVQIPVVRARRRQRAGKRKQENKAAKFARTIRNGFIA